MQTSSVLFMCILVTCSVLTVHGRSLEVRINDDKLVGEEIPAEAGKIPGVCCACICAMNKVKGIIGPNATEESVTAQLNEICKKLKLGILETICRSFVKNHLGQLIKEVTSNDDVRTICVNTGACKPKELLDLVFHGGNKDPCMEMNEYP